MSYSVGEVVYDADMLSRKIVRRGCIERIYDDGSFTVKFENKKLGVMCNNKGWMWDSGKVWRKEEIPKKMIEDFEEFK